jgi:hypothetical protein
VPIPVVLVQIAPPDPEPQLVELLLDACSEGIREATCVLADGTTWGVAIVSWRNRDETRVRVEFGRRDDAADAWQSREVVFEPADTREERWRTVGYTVGTLAEREAPSEDRPPSEPARTVPPPPPAADESPAPPATPATPPDHDDWLRVNAALVGGPGLTGGPWRGGIEGRLTAIPLAPLFATASAHHLRSARRDAAAARWTGITVGLGGQLVLDPLRLDLDAELLAENLLVEVSDGDLRDTGNRWSIGVLGRLAASWPRRGPVGAIASAEVWTLRESTAISVRNAPAGRWPSEGFSLAIGAELRIR